jgi:helix-turn-helix protein
LSVFMGAPMGNKWRQWAFGIEGLRGSQKPVLVALADICHDCDAAGRPNDTCYPKIATLARLVDCSERTVQRALAALEDVGYVIGHAQARRNGSQSSNLYRLVKTPAGRQLSLFDGLLNEPPKNETPTQPALCPQAVVDKPPETGPDPSTCPMWGDKLTGHIGQTVTPKTNPLTTFGQEGADVRPLVSLQDFIEGYDKRGLTNPNALKKAWARLGGQRKVRAVRALPNYNAVLKAQPWREVKGAHSFLTQGAFDDYQEAPLEAAPPDKSGNPKPYLAAFGSPQWNAWAAYETQKLGQPPFWVAHCKNQRRQSWPFPSQWPPQEEKEKC